MSEQTEWLANPRFAALVSGSAFHTRELADGKLAVFLNIPMKVLETTPALARCIVGALLNAVYEANGQVKGRVLLLLGGRAPGLHVVVGPRPRCRPQIRHHARDVVPV